MIANHIHDALAQVRKVQELILAKRNFRGYSGTARAFGGLAAFAGSVLIYSFSLRHSAYLHLAVWGAVLCVSLLLNYVALFRWFLFDKEAGRDFQKLLPAIDALPALSVGALLTIALVINSQFGLLFGVWMMLYGLAHVSYRLSLPGENYIVGIYYIICGSVCLFAFNNFSNPWPMGIVFLFGEAAGGLIFNRNKTK